MQPTHKSNQDATSQHVMHGLSRFKKSMPHNLLNRPSKGSFFAVIVTMQPFVTPRIYIGSMYLSIVVCF